MNPIHTIAKVCNFLFSVCVQKAFLSSAFRHGLDPREEEVGGEGRHQEDERHHLAHDGGEVARGGGL